MSSPRKDARWQLATTLAKEAGFDSINAITYNTSAQLLAVAEKVLDEVTEEKIDELAKKWNSDDDD